jgi:hypothetical protein
MGRSAAAEHLQAALVLLVVDLAPCVALAKDRHRVLCRAVAGSACPGRSGEIPHECVDDEYEERRGQQPGDQQEMPPATISPGVDIGIAANLN